MDVTFGFADNERGICVRTLLFEAGVGAVEEEDCWEEYERGAEVEDVEIGWLWVFETGGGPVGAFFLGLTVPKSKSSPSSSSSASEFSGESSTFSRHACAFFTNAAR